MGLTSKAAKAVVGVVVTVATGNPVAGIAAASALHAADLERQRHSDDSSSEKSSRKDDGNWGHSGSY